MATVSQTNRSRAAGVRSIRLQNILGTYIVQRIISYIVTVWGSFTIAFFFFRLLPGDPLRAYILSLEQTYSMKFEGSADMIKAYRQEFGIDGTPIEQYFSFMKRVFINHDLGPSMISFPTHAQDVITRYLPWTLGLLITSVLIAWVLGLLLGSMVGFYRGTRLDNTLSSIAIGLSQIPQYFVALILLFVFAYTMSWLPARDAYDASVAPGLTPDFIFSILQHSFLPGLSLVIVALAGYMLRTRSLIVTILGEDYLTYAQAKGLKQGTIMRNYALRNALLPELTALAFSLGGVLNGAFLVEYIFNYPGIGYLFVQATQQLDYNVMQGIVLMSIFSVLTATFILDLLLPLVDPRVRRA